MYKEPGILKCLGAINKLNTAFIKFQLLWKIPNIFPPTREAEGIRLQVLGPPMIMASLQGVGDGGQGAPISFLAS